ncbi:protein FATTY ACID EXPORT 5-like [Curcuma longa]|uniref:protein FATTY ACID EXPORT 5-like n=1 Tax=Curcuma longa TaxID=136217 RepID=UPI003D9E86F5
MHDFCFTIPYGFLVLIGGIVGYLRRGSAASLAGGAGSGLVLLLAGFISLKAFEKRRNSYFALGLDEFSILNLAFQLIGRDELRPIICSLTLAYIMGKRYLETSKIMPAGLVATLSALMSLFYLYKMATGANHIPPKAD